MVSQRRRLAPTERAVTQRPSADRSPRLSTGIAGLDEVLDGGLIRGRAYLVRGDAGAGKTTLGLHFLTAAASDGQNALFISLGESGDQLRKDAAAQGFDLARLAFLDLSPKPEFFAQAESYDIFSPAEVEREPTAKRIMAEFDKLRPARVFIDSMTQFRYLATDAFQFRKQALSFLRFLVERGATVMFTSESSRAALDDDLQFMADGVIELDLTPEGRTVAVTKFRGSDLRPGLHSLRLGETGMAVFPRLTPDAYARDFATETIPSGIPELDQLLGGGLERGTITLVSGPTGVGKTTLGMSFMKDAAGRGERSVVYSFEEGSETLLLRCESVNIPVRAMLERGTLSVVRVEPLQFTPDEFAQLVRAEVEQGNARIVMLDSISGYRVALRGGDLVAEVHSLARYLANMGVTVLLVNEIEAITGDFRATEVGVSYLADNIVFLRYLEIDGRIRKTVGVLKKRLSDFEKSLREIEITRYGIKVGAPLSGLRGILGGTPGIENGANARTEGPR
jgi:circadian clock protein KaiC